MKDLIFDDFQDSVDKSLLRNKSILDIITKLQESEGKINRAVIKAVTNCGCIQIDAKKQKYSDPDMEEIRKALNTHLKGKLCDNCRDIIEQEIGRNIFYLASLCNVLDVSLFDVLLKEYNKIDTLGKYNLR